MGRGALMAFIYFSWVMIFPFLPGSIEGSEPMMNMESYIRQERYLLIPFILGLAGVFYLYWSMIRIVHTFEKEYGDRENSLRLWIIGMGALSGVILIGLYPIGAIDVALYVIRARLWAIYGESPMIALPINFPHEPYMAIGLEYAGEPSPYGPLWELIAQIPMRLGFVNIESGIASMKIISLISYLATALLIGWYAQQDSFHQAGRVTALAFFVLNPLVLVEGIGNGHNDMLMLLLITLGLILWQRDQWAWAAFFLTLASLVKGAGLILLPLFGITVLAAVKEWRARVIRGIWISIIFLATSIILYRLTGPFPAVLAGAKEALFNRVGYSPTYVLLLIAKEVFPQQSEHVLPALQIIFIIYFVHLLILLARNKVTLIEAGFLAYFSQFFLGAAFRPWYPLWLVPIAALELNSRFYWRTFLFSLTAELSALNYAFLWAWGLSTWNWGLSGPLGAYWNFGTIIPLLTVPWTFGLPILGDLIGNLRNRERFKNSLWI